MISDRERWRERIRVVDPTYVGRSMWSTYIYIFGGKVKKEKYL